MKVHKFRVQRRFVSDDRHALPSRGQWELAFDGADLEFADEVPTPGVYEYRVQVQLCWWCHGGTVDCFSWTVLYFRGIPRLPCADVMPVVDMASGRYRGPCCLLPSSVMMMMVMVMMEMVMMMLVVIMIMIMMTTMMTMVTMMTMMFTVVVVVIVW